MDQQSENHNQGQLSLIVRTERDQWQNMTMEQVAISVALAHVARTDNQIQRMAFTTEINQGFSYNKNLFPLIIEREACNLWIKTIKQVMPRSHD